MMNPRVLNRAANAINHRLHFKSISNFPITNLGSGVSKDGQCKSPVSERIDRFNTLQSLGSKLVFKRHIHSSSQNESEAGRNTFFNRENPRNNSQNEFEAGRNTFFNRENPRNNSQNEFEAGRNTFFNRENPRNNRSMNFARDNLPGDRRDPMGLSLLGHYNIENNADIVHVKLMKNNTFVTITDSKGNKKIGASSGCLAEMKGGPKISRYSAEATAEHIGRAAKNMGIKSVVIKVNGFTYFKKKKQAILSFRDGYTNSRSDQNPIVYLEDTTRKAHNGCRLRKQRRI